MKVVAAGAGRAFITFLEKLKGSDHSIVSVFACESADEQARAKIHALGVPLSNAAVTTPEFQREIEALTPDLLVCFGVMGILGSRVLQIPKYGAINLHAGLLPLQRGMRGDYAAFVNDKRYGVSVHFMDDGIDSGDVFHVRSWPVEPEDRVLDHHRRVWLEGPEALMEAIDLVASNRVMRIAQDRFAYYPRQPRWDEYMRWEDSSQRIYDSIRVRTPETPSFSFHRGKIIFILEASLVDSVRSYAAPVGQVIGKVPGKGSLVKTGDTAILITRASTCTLDPTRERVPYPFPVPQESFVPEFAVGEMLGMSLEAELYDALQEIRELKRRLEPQQTSS